MQNSQKILCVNKLNVSYGNTRIVKGANFALEKGELLGIVGESGCGKSTLLRSIMLLKNNNTIIDGSINYNGVELTELADEKLRQLRGNEISMIPQNAYLSMNPTSTISSLFYETVRMHRKGIKRKESDTISSGIMNRLLLEDSERILKSYPFELSGGMCQRIAIALAMINSPMLILADEPTSALDVTSQLEVVEQIRILKREFGVSLVLISHNFGVVAGLSDNVAIIYGGMIVEYGTTEEILNAAMHPYTKALIAAIPDMNGNISKGLAGTPPSFASEITGCPFAERCESAKDVCNRYEPKLINISKSHYVKCCCI